MICKKKIVARLFSSPTYEEKAVDFPMKITKGRHCAEGFNPIYYSVSEILPKTDLQVVLLQS